MAKLRKVLSTDVNEPVWRAVGPLDIRFAGGFVDAFYLNPSSSKDEHVLEIWPSSMDDTPYGFAFAVPAGNGWGRRRRWVPVNLNNEEVTAEEIEDACGITIYIGECPVVSIVEHNATTYVYVAKQPDELYGSPIGFAPLTLHCAYDKDGEKFF